MAIIGDCGYWPYTSVRSVRLYTNGCVVNSGTGLIGLCTGRNQVIVKDNHGHETKVHRRDLKVIDSNTNVAEMYGELRKEGKRDAEILFYGKIECQSREGSKVQFL